VGRGGGAACAKRFNCTVEQVTGPGAATEAAGQEGWGRSWGRARFRPGRAAGSRPNMCCLGSQNKGTQQPALTEAPQCPFPLGSTARPMQPPPCSSRHLPALPRHSAHSQQLQSSLPHLLHALHTHTRAQARAAPSGRRFGTLPHAPRPPQVCASGTRDGGGLLRGRRRCSCAALPVPRPAVARPHSASRSKGIRGQLITTPVHAPRPAGRSPSAAPTVTAGSSTGTSRAAQLKQFL
jgi:hypothetical protein